MKNMSIRARLIMAFGFLILLTMVMTAIGYWDIESNNAYNKEIALRQRVDRQISDWANAVNGKIFQVHGYTLATDPDTQAFFKQSMDSSTVRITDYGRAIDALINDPAARELYDKVLAERKQYVEAVDGLIVATEGWQAEARRDLIDNKIPVIQTTYLLSLNALRKFQTDQLGMAQRASEANNEFSTRVFLAAALLALLLGLFSAWRVIRAITRPLRHAVALAQTVANRDLTPQIHVRGRDEIGQLLSALDGMVGSLGEAMGEVRLGANAIASASGQIRAGNEDLAARTEEQASSLSETAATMEQITSTVRQNADNAHQANTLAATAAQKAGAGGDIVAQLVTTMSEINEKSRQVADITGVIDSIAFQTNILALNAAVEAARAGEQGKGFAVVASEVRALAQRSAAAAKEIKDLIHTSVEATRKGSDQADQAGHTMQEIVDAIRHVTDIVGEISSASREQTTGIEQINTAITQMDDVTHQNASLVEQSAAAATSLQEQAATLAHLVATFRLKETAGVDDIEMVQPVADAGAPVQGDAANPAALPDSPRSAAALAAPATDRVEAGARRPRALSAPRPSPAPAHTAGSLAKPVTAQEEWTEF